MRLLLSLRFGHEKVYPDRDTAFEFRGLTLQEKKKVVKLTPRVSHVTSCLVTKDLPFRVFLKWHTLCLQVKYALKGLKLLGSSFSSFPNNAIKFSNNMITTGKHSPVS